MQQHRLVVGLVLVCMLGLFSFIMYQNAGQNTINPGKLGVIENSFAHIDPSSITVPIDQVFSGGVPKDGIPALTNPEFEPLGESAIDMGTQAVLIDINGEQRLYPYNILVWHEIVNDSIGDKHFAVTFCPLCGSAIVFDRAINGKILEFGVSGLLYESNLVMYDRSAKASLWSQALGKSIAGPFSDTSLEYVPFQLLRLQEARAIAPNAMVMTTNTGHNRNYTNTPYSGYGDTAETYFPVSVQDSRFFAKEIMYVTPLNNGGSLAIPANLLTSSMSVRHPELPVEVRVDTNGQIQVIDTQTESLLPSYYEMWFSWATHHQQTGTVWTPQST